jgi:hypothetical protein
MIPDRLWSSLDLDTDVLRRRAEFLAGYAEVAAEFPEIDPAAYEYSSGDESRVGIFPEEGPEGDGLDSRPIRVKQQQWLIDIERADALREAAESMLLLDLKEGARLLEGSSLYFTRWCPAYGDFLGTVAAPDTAEDRVLSAMHALSSTHKERRERFAPVPPTGPRAVYLLMTIGGFPGAVREAQPPIKEMRSSASARSQIPFGTSRSPLADWWALAMMLGSGPKEIQRERIVSQLELLARPHGEQMRVAQFDRYHWRRLRGRVDLVDLEVAGVVSIVSRRLAAEGSGPLSLEDFEADLPPLAQVSLAVGIDLGEGELGPGTGSRKPFNVR